MESSRRDTTVINILEKFGIRLATGYISRATGNKISHRVSSGEHVIFVVYKNYKINSVYKFNY